MKRSLVSTKMLVAMTLVVNATGAFANSELDPRPLPGNAPRVIVQKLDPTTQIVTTYRVPAIDASLRPESLSGLSQEAQKAKIDAFLTTVARPENKIDEAKAEKAALPRTELEGETSTPAWGYRWRGGWGRGWYGGGYYGGWGGYYRPYWGYSYGYGYYNSGYYNRSYYGGYYGGYYPYYTVYGCGW